MSPSGSDIETWQDDCRHALAFSIISLRAPPES
jgi:hypothetical protein